jgi:uncharacterized protein YbbC (DUF1343 family)
VTALLLAAAVQVGLDVVAAQSGRPLLGRRVGLVAHAASVAADGRGAAEVLRSRGVEVVRLFAPEHGLHGEAAAGEEVPDTRDAASGLPVLSLYGPSRKPRPEDLRGLDALVFDLQDAGVRFYTYATTLLLCLDAAADAGLELVVLDRPNPLGGERIEGPLADPGLNGFPALAPGPLVHGLTLGEMARFANARRARPARLTVVPMRGWRRTMTWRDTGRAWTPPSPNLRTPEAVLAYPGTALLEATNLSEGRGTDTPFLLLGAPWFEARALAAALEPAGFTVEPTRFTPRSSRAAPDPRYRDVECSGLRVGIPDAALARPYAFGLGLLHGLRHFAAFRFLREGSALDALLGTPRVRAALEGGEAVSVILAQDAPGIEAFRRERSAALLY